jgi:hypothetical protein
VQSDNILSLDKIICVRYSCAICKKISYIKADMLGHFPAYMQCVHCEQHFSTYTQPISMKLNIHIMSKVEIEWLSSIQLRQFAAKDKPLRVYRTRETIF